MNTIPIVEIIGDSIAKKIEDHSRPDMIRVVKEPISEHDRMLLTTFAMKSSFQKRKKSSVKVNDKTTLYLTNALASHVKSKARAIMMGYLNAMQLSLAHHVYGKPVADLKIISPAKLTQRDIGIIGEYVGMPICFSGHHTMYKSPPVLINSKHEHPIRISLGRTVQSSLAPKYVSIMPTTVFANCTKIVDSDLMISLQASHNHEEFRRFMTSLNSEIANGYEKYKGHPPT